MAQISFPNNTFTGSFDAIEIFKKLYTGNDVLTRDLMDVRFGVKSKTPLRTIDVDPVFENYDAKFSTVGTGVPIAGERYLDPVSYEVRLELDTNNFKETWETQFLEAGSLKDWEGDQRLLLAMTDVLLQRSMHYNGALFFNGKSYKASNFTFTAAYDGLLPTMIADTSVNSFGLTGVSDFSQAITGLTLGATTTVAHASNTNIKVGDVVTFSSNVGGTTQIRGLSGRVISTTGTSTVVSLNSTGFTAWTSGGSINFINQSNVKKALDAVWALTPDAVKDSPDCRIYLPRHIYEAYVRAEASTASTNIKYSFNENGLDYLGYQVEKMTDFLNNCILVTNWRNLVLGLDLEDDMNKLNVTFPGAITNEMVHRFRLGMKSAVNYIFPEQIAIIKPAN